MSKLNIVEIVWYDSGGIDGLVWEFKNEFNGKPHKIRTVGYLIEDNADYLAVAQSENSDQWGRTFVIPKGCVKYIKLLTLSIKTNNK